MNIDKHRKHKKNGEILIERNLKTVTFCLLFIILVAPNLSIDRFTAIDRVW